MSGKVKITIKKVKQTQPIVQRSKEEKERDNFLQSIIHFFPDAKDDLSKLYFDESVNESSAYIVRICCKASRTFIGLSVHFEIAPNTNLFIYDQATRQRLEEYMSNGDNVSNLYRGFFSFMPADMFASFIRHVMQNSKIRCVGASRITFDGYDLTILMYHSSKSYRMTFKRYVQTYEVAIPSASIAAMKRVVSDALNVRIQDCNAQIEDAKKKVAVEQNALAALETF